MRRARLTLLPCLALLAVLTAEEPLRLPQSAIDLPVDPAVVWDRLDNGLIVAAMANAEPDDKLSLRLFVRSGSRQETIAERGIAHYLEHMAFNGSEAYAPGELVVALQGVGVEFGREFNAHTGFEETVYKIDLPDAEPGTLQLGLRVLTEIAGRLTLPEAEIDRERGVILAEMRDRDTPGLRAGRALYDATFADTIIADRFPIGVRETVEAFDHAAMAGYYQRWYRPDRMVLAVVGDLDPDAVLPAVRSSFGALAAPAEPVATEAIPPVTAAEFATLVHHDAELGGATLRWHQIRPGQPPVDGVATRRRDLHEGLAAAVFARRMADIAEQADAPILDGSLSIYHRFDHQIVTWSVSPKPGRDLAAVAVLEAERRRLLEHGITAGELATVVAARRAARENAVEQAALRSNRQLAGALYESVRDDRVFQSPAQLLALETPWLDAVTPADCQTALQAAVADPRRQVLALLTPHDPGEGAEAALRQAWRASAEEPVAAPAEADHLAWAYGDAPEAPVTVEREELPFGVVGLRWPNGVAGRVLARDEKPNEVLIRLTLAFPVGQRPLGIDGLAGSTFISSGLGVHDASELRRLMAGRSVQINGPAIGDDQLTFSASCPPDEIPLALQWLRALLLDPAWREPVYQRNIDAWVQSLTADRSDLDSQMGRRWAQLTAGGYGYRHQIGPAQAGALSADAVRAWLAPLLREAPLEVAIVGDVDAERCTDLLGTWFGSLPPRQAIEPLLDPTLPESLAPIAALPFGRWTFTYDGTVARSVVRVAWPTDDIADIGFRRRMSVVGMVLDEILREDVREALGQAYSPYGGHRGSMAFEGRGYLVANIAVAPGQEDTVLAVLDKRIAELREQGIGEELFQRLVTPLRKRLPTIRDSNGYWLGSVVAGSSMNPAQWRWAESFLTDYDAITAAEITTLWRRYLVDDDRLELIGTSTGAGAEEENVVEEEEPAVVE